MQGGRRKGRRGIAPNTLFLDSQHLIGGVLQRRHGGVGGRLVGQIHLAQLDPVQLHQAGA